MLERLTQRAMFLAAGVLCVVGVVDSLRIGSPATAIVFGLVLASVLAMARGGLSSRPIEVRRDLREWLDDVSSLTGESVGDICDTALSSYRAGLVDRER